MALDLVLLLGGQGEELAGEGDDEGELGGGDTVAREVEEAEVGAGAVYGCGDERAGLGGGGGGEEGGEVDDGEGLGGAGLGGGWGSGHFGNVVASRGHGVALLSSLLTLHVVRWRRILKGPRQPQVGHGWRRRGRNYRNQLDVSDASTIDSQPQREASNMKLCMQSCRESNHI